MSPLLLLKSPPQLQKNLLLLLSFQLPLLLNLLQSLNFQPL